MPMQLGNSTELDRDHRIIAVSDPRQDRCLYMIEIRHGPVEWAPASSRKYANFEDAVTAGQKLRHRERIVREQLPGGTSDPSWPGPSPWATFREAREVHDVPPQLSARIRRGRKRVGWR